MTRVTEAEETPKSFTMKEFIGKFNSFQAFAPLTAHEKGVHFFGEHISLKNGSFCPVLATIQPLSKARVFLLRVKISEGCFVSDAPPAISHPYLIIALNS
jgi:hypothetical protein